MATLKLTVSKAPFEVMFSGEKNSEYRACSPWIESRLFDKNGKAKEYGFVEITHGYGKNRPSFEAKFLGVTKEKMIKKSYSNGLIVEFDECYEIKFNGMRMLKMLSTNEDGSRNLNSGNLDLIERASRASQKASRASQKAASVSLPFKL